MGRLSKKLLLGTGLTVVGLGILGSISLWGINAYYAEHFLPFTMINGTLVGGDTAVEAGDKLLAANGPYSLSLVGRAGYREVVEGKDIGFSYDIGSQLVTIKEEQKAEEGFINLLRKHNYEFPVSWSYDEAALEKRLEQLGCFDSRTITLPEDATVVYNGERFGIVSGEIGNAVDKQLLLTGLKEAIEAGESELDLEAKQYYKKPALTQEAYELIHFRDTLNRYLNCQIVYDFGESKEVIDQDEIYSWLLVDNYNVTLDEAAIYEYIKKLAESYNTLGGCRKFMTSLGDIVEVNGGNLQGGFY